MRLQNTLLDMQKYFLCIPFGIWNPTAFTVASFCNSQRPVQEKMEVSKNSGSVASGEEEHQSNVFLPNARSSRGHLRTSTMTLPGL